MLDSILQFIEQAPPVLVLATIFLASYLENIFPPVPGDTILLFCAYLVGRGSLSLGTAVTTTIVASFAGFATMYYLGRRLGQSRFLVRQQSWFSEKSLSRINDLFQRWGYGVIAMNRFMAGLRTVVALFAGFGRLNAVKVLSLALLSVIFWNGGLLWLGASIGENWEQIGVVLKEYNAVVSVLIVTLILVLAIHRFVVVRQNLRDTNET